MTDNQAQRLIDASAMIKKHPECFRPKFDAWLLGSNWDIYAAFEYHSLGVHQRGRKHYAANTIIEYLRHSSFLEDSDSEFKISDQWTSSIARLFVMLNPQCAHLFEFRENPYGVVKMPVIETELVTA
jgi:hypothetical protein